MKTKLVKLKNRPVGLTKAEDFEIVTEEVPQLKANELLLKAVYISVDPYLRGKMSGTKVPRFETGEPINSKLIAEVVESNNQDFAAGTYVSHYLNWAEYQVSDGSDLEKIDPGQVSLSAYLGALGVTGLSAYFALTDIGQPKYGETLVVSGAAGAVGSIAGQVGKLMGCRVVGIVGSDQKAELIKTKFGFDEAVNYNTCGDMATAIKSVCSQGVDIYFDNVGGAISDGVIENINTYGRIVACGSISNYNDVEKALSPSLLPIIVYKFLRIQGFLIADYRSRFPEGKKRLQNWLNEEKISYAETILKGFEQLPEAFIGLFNGLNEGKMIVEV
jgi:NADPH-dependent curcumin reductase CurA